MNQILLDNIPFQIDFAYLLKQCRVDEENEDAARLKQLVTETETIGKLKALLKVAYIETKDDHFVIIDGVRFDSRVLRVNLEQANRIFPFVVTCGRELDSWSETIDDPLENYWADSIKVLVLNTAVQFLEEYVKQHFNPGPISSMNPGSLPDWPLNEQPKLFSILGSPYDLVGVELSSSCLMIPTKSLSGIYFSTDTGFANCQLCSKENCSGRRASYDRKLYHEKYCCSTKECN